MPCCWPPTLTAATSSSPPAAAIACCSACHHASGSTSVPGGCGAEPNRRSAPVAASRTTTVADWVEESIPATRVPSGKLIGSCLADQVPQGQLVQPDETVVPLTRGVGVEVLEGGAVGEQVGHALPRGQRRLRQLEHPGVGERLLHLGVLPVGLGLGGQQQVGLHVRPRRV